MLNFVQPGNVLQHVASGAKTSGSVVVIGTKIGVCIAAIANGESGAILVKGVVTLPCVTAGAIAQGAAVYWDVADTQINTSSTGNTLAGYAAKAKVSGDTTIEVQLNG